MKIIELRAENVKGLVAIDITPDGDLVEIAGKNGAGKSSVLDAIWLALGGKEAGKDITAALRNGQDKGFVELTLDNGLIVHRGWSRNAEDVVTTSLKVVRDKDGIKSSVGSPQTTLDALRAITLDPEGFLRLTPRQQRESLLDLLDLGIDLDEWARQRNKIFADRTEYGRQAKALGDPAVDDDLPDLMQSAQDLIARIREAEQSNRVRFDLIEVRNRAAQRLDDARQELVNATNAFEDAEAKAKAAPALIDTSELEVELTGVEELNQRISANNTARTTRARKQALETEYAKATKKLEMLDAKKSAALAEAKVPLDGLSISEDGVTFQGVPLGDVNTADQIKVVLHVIAALNPRLRIIQIRQGSLLDEDSLSAVREFATDKNFQIWVEVVGSGSEDAINIIAGEVAV